MVATTLTQNLIDDGENLLGKLDASGIRIDAALWFYFPESGFWKLMLAFPTVEKEGPKAAYSAIQKVLTKMGEKALDLGDIAITNPRAQLLSLLKKFIRTGNGVSGIRFSNNVIDGQLISDAYIYRLG